EVTARVLLPDEVLDVEGRLGPLGQREPRGQRELAAVEEPVGGLAGRQALVDRRRVARERPVLGRRRGVIRRRRRALRQLSARCEHGREQHRESPRDRLTTRQGVVYTSPRAQSGLESLRPLPPARSRAASVVRTNVRFTEENEMTGNRHDLYINGARTAAQNNAEFPVYNPATGEAFLKVADASRADARKAVEAAAEAQPAWAALPHSERARLLTKAGDVLAARQAEVQ